MNPSTFEHVEQLSVVDTVSSRDVVALSGNDSRREPDPIWLFEDLEEPETWSLASFADLLPQEMV